jgi:hypothetical protein
MIMKALKLEKNGVKSQKIWTNWIGLSKLDSKWKKIFKFDFLIFFS